MRVSSYVVRRGLYMMVMVALAGSMQAIGAAATDNTSGSGVTAAISENQFAGTVTLSIRGQEKLADLLVTVLEPPVVDANGVQYVTATHEFTFADGSSITTSDREVATPTETEGLYDLVASMGIASGTGLYEGVTGQLEAHGTIDFAAVPPVAQFELTGVVCEDTIGSGASAGISESQFSGTVILMIHGQEKARGGC